GGALVVHAAEQVTGRTDGDGVLVALGLDDDFPPEYWPVVEGYAVDTAISRCLGLPGFQAHLGEQVRDQGFELARLELHQVRPLVQSREDVGLLDEPGVDHVELQDWADGCQFRWVL